MARVSPRRKPASSAREVGASGFVPRRIAAARAVRDPRERAVGGCERDDARVDEDGARVAPAGARVEAGGRYRLEAARELDPVARFEDAQPARVVACRLDEHDAVDAGDAHVRARAEARAVGVRDERAPHLHLLVTRDRRGHSRSTATRRARAA